MDDIQTAFVHRYAHISRLQTIMTVRDLKYTHYFLDEDDTYEVTLIHGVRLSVGWYLSTLTTVAWAW